MNTPTFLYHFAKVYVPGLLLLCIWYTLSGNLPSLIINNNKNEPQGQSNPVPQIQKQFTPKHSAKKHIPQPNNYQPAEQYRYIIELASGGFMKAQDIKSGSKTVKIIVSDKYSVLMKKEDIKSIKKYWIENENKKPRPKCFNSYKTD